MPDPLVNGSMTSGQLSLFEPSPALPAGFRYGASLISPEHRASVKRLAKGGGG